MFCGWLWQGNDFFQCWPRLWSWLPNQVVSSGSSKWCQERKSLPEAQSPEDTATPTPFHLSTQAVGWNSHHQIALKRGSVIFLRKTQTRSSSCSSAQAIHMFLGCVCWRWWEVWVLWNVWIFKKFVAELQNLCLLFWKVCSGTRIFWTGAVAKAMMEHRMNVWREYKFLRRERAINIAYVHCISCWEIHDTKYINK